MRMYRIIVYLLAAVAMVLPLASGCVSNSPVEQAVICRDKTKAGEPLLAADNLTPDIKTIYCSVKLAAVQPKSLVKAEWYVVKSSEAELADTIIGAGTVAAEAPYVVFAFTRSDKLLPRGDYLVKLYFDDKFVQSVPFYVQGEPAASAVILSDATMCAGIDQLTGKPIARAGIFPSDTPSIYCSVKVAGAQFNDQVTARWTYIGGELTGAKDQKIAESAVKVEGREYISYSFGPKAGQLFPMGEYSIGLYLDDRELVNLPFTVVSTADIKGPYAGETVVYAYKDKEKKEVNATASFPVDTSDIIFRAKIYNAPPETQMSLQWIIARSDEAGVEDYLMKEDKYTINGTDVLEVILTRGKDNFVKGDYMVKLLLDGQEKAAVPFRVQ
jgi:hypothetical protein